MYILFFFKQKTAYEMRISDWSSDVCSSDLSPAVPWNRRVPFWIKRQAALLHAVFQKQTPSPVKGKGYGGATARGRAAAPSFIRHPIAAGAPLCPRGYRHHAPAGPLSSARHGSKCSEERH